VLLYLAAIVKPEVLKSLSVTPIALIPLTASAMMLALSLRASEAVSLTTSNPNVIVTHSGG